MNKKIGKFTEQDDIRIEYLISDYPEGKTRWKRFWFRFRVGIVFVLLDAACGMVPKYGVGPAIRKVIEEASRKIIIKKK